MGRQARDCVECSPTSCLPIVCEFLRYYGLGILLICHQIGATAVGNGQIELAQTFVIGSLLCNHLLVCVL